MAVILIKPETEGQREGIALMQTWMDCGASLMAFGAMLRAITSPNPADAFALLRDVATTPADRDAFESCLKYVGGDAL